MTFNNIETKVLEWASDRKILQNSTPQQQFLKLVSEMGELADNLAKGRDARDDFGDCLVVLTIIAKQLGYSGLTECFQVAFDDIKDRRGYLNENGVFIKDTDPAYEQLRLEA